MKFLLAIQVPLILLWTNIDQSRGNEHLQAAHQILMDNADAAIGVVRHQLESHYDQLVSGVSQTRADIANLCNGMLLSLQITHFTQYVVTCVFLDVIWLSYGRTSVSTQPVPNHAHTRYLDRAWEMLNEDDHSTIGPFAHLYPAPGTKTVNACHWIEDARDTAPMKYVVVCRLLVLYIWQQSAALMDQYPDGFIN